MAVGVLVRNAWYVAGLSHEFAPQQLPVQVVGGKPLVLWRTAAGRVVAFDDRCVHKRMAQRRLSTAAGSIPVAGSSILLIENLPDITHFYPLQDGNIGDGENSPIPVTLDKGESDGNPMSAPSARCAAVKEPPYLADYFGCDVVDRRHTHHMLSPAVTRVAMRVWPEGSCGDRRPSVAPAGAADPEPARTRRRRPAHGYGSGMTGERRWTGMR